MELYVRLDNNWPSLDILKKNRKIYKNVKIIDMILSVYIQRVQATGLNLYKQRICILCSAELIKANREICYGTHLDSVVKVISEKLEPVSQLSLYNEEFKRSCLKGYLENLKHQAKKKLIMFYMIHCEGLCYDVVEYIMKFY